MIIEITGPSGSGKTTYLQKLLSILEEKGESTGAIHSPELNKSADIPLVFSDLNRHNISTDLLAFPWALLFFSRNPFFVIFCLLRIFRLDESPKQKISVLRSFLRKVGIRRFLTRSKFKHVRIVVDEGLCHSAHNFLMSTRFHAKEVVIEKFTSLCPLPDAIVILTAPAQVLADRLKQRGDLSPRIIRDGDTFSFCENAYLLYKHLSGAWNGLTQCVVINSHLTSEKEALALGFSVLPGNKCDSS